MAVGDVGLPEVLPTLPDAQAKLGRAINPSVYPQEEFARKLRAGHHFLETVVSDPKRFVIGDKDDFAKLCARQTGSAGRR
jgi:hypothetical protein